MILSFNLSILRVDNNLKLNIERNIFSQIVNCGYIELEKIRDILECEYFFYSNKPKTSIEVRVTKILSDVDSFNSKENTDKYSWIIDSILKYGEIRDFRRRKNKNNKGDIIIDSKK